MVDTLVRGAAGPRRCPRHGKMTQVSTAAHTLLSHPLPRYEPLPAGQVPDVGEIVHLTGRASPQFAHDSILLQVTKVEPSSVDASRGRSTAAAGWLYLTGWELDRNRRHRVERCVLVSAAGLLVRR